jgi:hypothetical protein
VGIDHEDQNGFERRAEHHASGKIGFGVFAANCFLPIEPLQPPEFFLLVVGEGGDGHGDSWSDG